MANNLFMITDHFIIGVIKIHTLAKDRETKRDRERNMRKQHWRNENGKCSSVILAIKSSFFFSSPFTLGNAQFEMAIFSGFPFLITSHSSLTQHRYSHHVQSQEMTTAWHHGNLTLLFSFYFLICDGGTAWME